MAINHGSVHRIMCVQQLPPSPVTQQGGLSGGLHDVCEQEGGKGAVGVDFESATTQELLDLGYDFGMEFKVIRFRIKVVEEAVSLDAHKPGVVDVLGQKSSIADYLQTRKNSNFELFPMLVVLVLIFFAFEGYMASRFYKLK